MGQYWIPVNLDKKEFLHPHQLATGLKAREQLGTMPGTAQALMLLLFAMPEPRGGGDFEFGEPGSEYRKVVNSMIGRWRGDRIAIVGDYAEPGDLDVNQGFYADRIYTATNGFESEEDVLEYYREVNDPDNEPTGEELRFMVGWKNISDEVIKVLEYEFHGQFHGSGWRNFTPHSNSPHSNR